MAENSSFTLSKSQSTSVSSLTTGLITALTAASQGDYIEINTGFKPRYVAVENITDKIKIEWYEGMGDNTCVKTAAAGARTLETVGITVTDRTFQVSQNGVLAAIVTGKTIAVMAQG